MMNKNFDFEQSTLFCDYKLWFIERIVIISAP